MYDARSLLGKVLSLGLLLWGVITLTSKPESEIVVNTEISKPLGVAGLSPELQEVYKAYIAPSPIWIEPQVAQEELAVESSLPQLELVEVMTKEPLNSVN